MAEYSKVMEERNRMCDYYCKNYGIGEECSLECPLSGKNNPDLRYYSGCDEFLYKEAEKAEQIIMKWADEHPPLYPTIREVIEEICRLMGINPKTNLNTIYDEHLTKEVADKFNIKSH